MPGDLGGDTAMVATSLDAGPGMKKPWGLRASLNRSQTIPGSTIAYSPSTRISCKAFMACISTTIPPMMGTAEPTRPVPAPRGTTGITSLFANSTIF